MKRDLHLWVLSGVLSLALTACGGGGGGGGGSGDGGEVGTSNADGGGAVVMLSQDLTGAERAQPNPTMGALEAN